MNKLLITILVACFGLANTSFSPKTEGLTREDRKVIINYLKKSKTDLIEKIKNLTPEQWAFKPAPDVWSVGEICEHILKAESVVLRRVDNQEGMSYKPELITGYKQKADEVIAFIVGRETKLKAPEPVAPSGVVNSRDEFIRSFESRREETVHFVKSIDKPIKAYYEVFGPIGEVNGYHWLMFISAHTERHILQLNEVLNNPGFPNG